MVPDITTFIFVWGQSRSSLCSILEFQSIARIRDRTWTHAGPSVRVRTTRFETAESSIGVMAGFFLMAFAAAMFAGETTEKPCKDFDMVCKAAWNAEPKDESVKGWKI
eukprot:2113397-Rhodomonas_salina.1